MRYPLDRLAAQLGITLGVVGNPHDDERLVGTVLLAARLEVKHETLRTQLRRGLNERQADTMATKAGLHPALVWPEWWDEPTDDDGFAMAEVPGGSPPVAAGAGAAPWGSVRDA